MESPRPAGRSRSAGCDIRHSAAAGERGGGSSTLRLSGSDQPVADGDDGRRAGAGARRAWRRCWPGATSPSRSRCGARSAISRFDWPSTTWRSTACSRAVSPYGSGLVGDGAGAGRHGAHQGRRQVPGAPPGMVEGVVELVVGRVAAGHHGGAGVEELQQHPAIDGARQAPPRWRRPRAARATTSTGRHVRAAAHDEHRRPPGARLARGPRGRPCPSGTAPPGGRPAGPAPPSARSEPPPTRRSPRRT